VKQVLGQLDQGVPKSLRCRAQGARRQVRTVLLCSPCLGYPPLQPMHLAGVSLRALRPLSPDHGAVTHTQPHACLRSLQVPMGMPARNVYVRPFEHGFSSPWGQHKHSKDGCHCHNTSVCHVRAHGPGNVEHRKP